MITTQTLFHIYIIIIFYVFSTHFQVSILKIIVRTSVYIVCQMYIRIEMIIINMYIDERFIPIILKSGHTENED